MSGFFGSGKSHLIKMLTSLWENRAFSDGMRPIQLVRDLPDDVRAALTELDREATRAGGAFAAAGSMLSGQAERPRYSVLSIILKAAGFPGDFGQARFLLFLKDRAIEAEVRAAVEARGGTLEQEGEDLFVSPLIAEALLEVDATLGTTPKDVRDAIQAQFRSPDYDITKDQFTDVVRRVLRLQICRLTAPCVTHNSSAAFLKLMCRAVASKARNPFSGGVAGMMSRDLRSPDF